MKKEDFVKVFWAIAIGGGIISVYGILQYFGFDPILRNFEKGELATGAIGFTGAPNFFGQYLAVIFPLIIGLYFSVSCVRRKMGLMILGGVIFVALFLTHSRASFLGLHFALMMFTLMKVIKSSEKSKHLAFLFLLILIPVIGFFLISGDEFALRSFNSRLMMWGAAVKHIFAYPIFGTGLESFGLHFYEYINQDFYFYEATLALGADRPHNELLQMGVEGGVAAVIACLAMFVWIVKCYFVKVKKPLGIAVVISYFVYVFQNQFTFAGLTDYAILLLVLAFMIVSSSKRSDEGIKFSRLSSLFIFVCIIVGVGCFSYQNVYRPLMAEVAFSEGEYVEAIELAPYNSHYHYGAIAYEGEGNLDVLKHIEGNTYNVKSLEAMILKSEDEVLSEEIYLELLEINSTNAVNVLDYANALFEWGRYSEAAEMYEQFLELIPNFWRWESFEGESDFEVHQYEVFFKNTPYFAEVLDRALQSCVKVGNTPKVHEFSAHLNNFENLFRSVVNW